DCGRARARPHPRGEDAPGAAAAGDPARLRPRGPAPAEPRAARMVKVTDCPFRSHFSGFLERIVPKPGLPDVVRIFLSPHGEARIAPLEFAVRLNGPISTAGELMAQTRKPQKPAPKTKATAKAPAKSKAVKTAATKSAKSAKAGSAS